VVGPKRPSTTYQRAYTSFIFEASAMKNVIPIPVQGKKYISLTTFRKNGVGVPTPVWFGENGDKLYVMTRSDMGKVKRIRNNPAVRNRAGHCGQRSHSAG
jgi:general stress protein 26